IATTPSGLHEVLRTLAEEYPLREGNNANIIFRCCPETPEKLKVSRNETSWLVEYGRESSAARGVAYALSGQECDENIFFKTFGILLDCTRGNIVSVSSFKSWLRRISMLGYNTAMIYVKDAYLLENEPYFGYMRGAYSQEEIREIDAYAQKLKIEMIASIQALGHVEPVLRWSAYDNVKDTADVMLVDEPATYVLLKKILTFWSDSLSSRRIHLGMDETQTLGRGKFLDLNGYENPFNVYNRHLNRVCDICRELQLEPIIWSDMYFRYANKNMNYYDTGAEIPESVKKEIPSMVQLSYWDYYHRDEETYLKMLNRTRELNGNVPLMASGVWTWIRNWTDYDYTMATVRPCISACRKTGTDELVLTMWGDDGGYCDFKSAQAGLAWAADTANNVTEDHDRTAKLFEVVCGASYDLHLLCGKLTMTDPETRIKVSSAPILWDDPIIGIVWNELPGLPVKEAPICQILKNCREVAAATAEHRSDHNCGDFDYAWNLANVLIRKIELRQKLLESYAQRDNEVLKNIAGKEIPEILEAIDGLADAFRTQWLRSFKSYGLELMQIRLGGLSARYRELARVLEELISGKITSIHELEVKHTSQGHVPWQYLRSVTGCFFI
ncbi:MAG: family 20 glycosylhydrolase, partial [Lentisphaeria bacterium]|nr:family 20 glycosylhydrolase [Lentisphaeria bacterium]